MKASEYIAKIIYEKGLRTVFGVVGGGSMHLNDSFGNYEGINNYYFLHEQGASIAAEAYARINGEVALVSVTTGPGGINALNGVLCAWQDNIPMLVMSGQVKRSMMVENSGLNIRQLGEQEHSIVTTVKNMTKYAVSIQNPNEIKYCIDKAFYMATTGRRGPCWVDVPLDIQGMDIDITHQREFIPPVSSKLMEDVFDINEFSNRIRNAKRPVIIVGSAVRSAGSHSKVMKMIESKRIPVIAARSNADLINTEHELYFGNFGSNGGRAGNYIVQNADLLLVVGCRLSVAQIGFNYELFSPDSYKIMVEIDSEEIRKPTINIDFPINCDVNDFAEWFETCKIDFEAVDERWLEYCKKLKNMFPIYEEKYKDTEGVNPYYFAKVLADIAPEDFVCVVGNSCSCVAIKQMGVRKKEQRMWGNINCGTMGYDLPAAIGACIANSKKDVICLAGDGSIQMNIQELQTVINYNLPIKIFVFNNGGYRSIVLSQGKNFKRLSGCTEESGLKLPSIKALATAYGINYMYCDSGDKLGETMRSVLKADGPVICEVIEDPDQTISPKLGNKVLPDGSIVSPSLCDMEPEIPDEIKNKYSIFENYIREKRD